MNDKKRILSPDEVRDAGLTGWTVHQDRIETTYQTGDFAAGLALVNRIGQAAEAANHHPDLTLTYPSVGVVLSSHDVGGLTSRDVELAREINGFADEAGISHSED